MPLRRANKFTLEFSNMEGSPSYPLTGNFVVGSEVGDVVISDPTLSPKHATFMVKNGLVSIIDHGSAEGTKLKGNPLPTGRAVILEVDDEIELGSIVIRLNGTVDENVVEEVPAEEVAPSPKVVSAPPIPAQEDKTQQVYIEPIIRAPKAPARPGFFARLKNKFTKKKVVAGKSGARKATGGGVQRSANAIPRIFGILLDIIWTLALWEIFSPFEEFMFILEIIPGLLQEHVLPLVVMGAAELGQAELLNDLINGFVSNVGSIEAELKLSYLVSLWMLVRLGGTLLLGVSLGDYMAGIRGLDNAVWKRAGGILREVIGFFTWPFIIFDLPALFSRKTLKEFLTFTTLHAPSKGFVVVSLVFFVPFSLAALLLSPFAAGLDLPEELVYVEKGKEPRDRSKEQAAATEQLVVVGSDWFGASFKIDNTKWWVLPRFTLRTSQTGRSLQPTLIFYNHADETKPAINIPLALDKSFDWAQILAPVFSHNIFAQQTYPTLWKYLESTKLNKSSALAFDLSDAQKGQFSIELQSLIASSFQLTPETLLDHLQTFGPFLKGYLNVKATLLALVEGNSEGTWTSLMISKTPFLMYERPGAKPLEFYIPLVFGKGRAYSVSYSSAQEKAKLSKVASKELWSKADWRLSAELQPYSIVRFIDTLAALAQPAPAESIRGELEQAYGAFFEASAALVTMPQENPRKISMLRTLDNVQSVLKQIIEYRRQMKQAVVIEESTRLLEKLADLKMQLESSNAGFFSTTPSGP